MIDVALMGGWFYILGGGQMIYMINEAAYVYGSFTDV